jgi:hypothetical protein
VERHTASAGWCVLPPARYLVAVSMIASEEDAMVPEIGADELY